MANNIDIKETCRQIIEESQAIIKYTESIEAIPNGTLVTVFDEVRSDELSHLQKLIVALTELMTVGETTEAEKLDEDAKGGDNK